MRSTACRGRLAVRPKRQPGWAGSLDPRVAVEQSVEDVLDSAKAETDQVDTVRRVGLEVLPCFVQPGPVIRRRASFSLDAGDQNVPIGGLPAGMAP
jgi:hypothetical protein